MLPFQAKEHRSQRGPADAEFIGQGLLFEDPARFIVDKQDAVVQLFVNVDIHGFPEQAFLSRLMVSGRSRPSYEAVEDQCMTAFY